MFEQHITPRFSETDALGHINNTVVPVWFEQARRPVFKLFTPDLDPGKWRLIIARIEVDFVGELHYGTDVVIRTSVDNVGNTSFRVAQEVWQQGKVRVKGLATLVHYDYQTQRSKPIPDYIREQLAQHRSE
ncbi:acyl-CoA thioesterase [Tunicatimonas pelagia]|uniref:acyl-CoA thioesterase n=1 Tax=Tunicatimonas pelagia TaxID=931531 RepID=UPI002666E736|nr:thioesterase family protein [Tunicatimonas pelagia]WKN40995.1 thioesterase family protein [Tunicatimonas pelagia]